MGPLLFIIYINDLDLGLVSKISKFADDTKMGINADSDAAVKQLQEDLRKVGEWSKKWQMPFNLDKCKIMHIGHNNKNEKYELLGKEIESVQQERPRSRYYQRLEIIQSMHRSSKKSPETTGLHQASV